MDFVAYAMGGLGKGGAGGFGGGFGTFLWLLLVVALVVAFIVITKYEKKGVSESICDDCHIVYTKGEKFCKKCGNSLTEK